MPNAGKILEILSRTRECGGGTWLHWSRLWSTREALDSGNAGLNSELRFVITL
jgi:hypothetical protein